MKHGQRWTAFEDRLLFEEGMTYGDIAERTGRNVGSVKGRRQVLVNAGHKLPPITRADGGKAGQLMPHNAPLGSPRPCACCHKTFQPTVRRRMTCETCFGNNGSLPPDFAA